MIRHVLYLDTSHISEIARNSSAPGAEALLRILQSDRAALAISLMHFIELASPDFASVGDVKALLREVPIAFAVSTEEVWASEMAVSCALAGGKVREPPRVFCRTALDWCRGPSPTPGHAVDYLEAFIEQPELRVQILDVAAEAARVSMMKAQAAIIRDPRLPLRLSVSNHLEEFRARNPDYAGGLTSEQVVDKAGGPPAFPSLAVFHCTISERLKLADQKSTINDVLDEYHAAYAPYAAATALDRRTVARVRHGGLAEKHRVTARLEEVSTLFEQVESGLLVPDASIF